MGCSCSKSSKTVTQPRKKINKPTSRIIHKTTHGNKTVRRVFERY